MPESSPRDFAFHILEAVEDGYAVLDGQLRFLFANTVAASALGQDPAGIPGRRLLDVLPGPGGAVLEAQCRRAMEEEVPISLRIPRSAGGRLYRIDAAPDGRERLILHFHEAAARGREGAGSSPAEPDLGHTERQWLEEEVRERVEELETVMEVAPVAIWVGRDPLCREIVGNRTANRFYEAATGENVSANVSPARRFFSGARELTPEELPMQVSAARGVDIRDAELEVLLPSGRRIIMLGHSSPLRDAAGEVRGAVGAFLDITARRRAEEQVRHYNAILEARNRIYRDALASGDPEELGACCLAVARELTGSGCGFVAEINADGRLEHIASSGPGWEWPGTDRASGKQRIPREFRAGGIYGRALLEGKGFFTNEPLSGADGIGAPPDSPALDAFLGAPLVHDGKAIGIIGLGNREDGYRPEDLQAAEALAQGMVEVLMLKRAEWSLRAHEERLRQAQKMESIGVLAAGVAHDFNNLLAGIMGNASLLDGSVSGEAQEKVEAIIKASEKAADLTRQLLAYAGKGRLVVEPLDAAAMVREMADLLRSSISKKVDLRLEMESDLPAVEADRGQLHQIIMNLVINAAEAIGLNPGVVKIAARTQGVAGSRRVADEVTGRLLPEGNYVCLEVTDSGSGMEPEVRGRVFDPFFTTKFVGRGLGLAAVAGIVRAHDGAIELETAPGRGAAFRIFLPAHAGRQAAPAARRIPENLRGSATVLLVDDEPMVRDFGRGALERFGYRVLLAGNGREAVRMVHEHADAIELVLLDLMMPVLGGDEAIALLKAGSPGVKVIVMSGYGESEAMKLFAGEGVSAFLQKPFTAARLAETVKLVLGGPAAAGSGA